MNLSGLYFCLTNLAANRELYLVTYVKIFLFRKDSTRFRLDVTLSFIMNYLEFKIIHYDVGLSLNK